MIWIAFIGHWILPAVLGNILNQPDFPLRGFPFERLIHAGLFFVLMFSTAALVAEIMLAWGFLNRQRWARVLGIVMGIVVLISIPFGTALGVYTLVILLGAGAEEEYRQIAEKTA